jgi:CheY-like chemotaxis protein
LLLVDNDADTLAMLRAVLEEQLAEVRIASSASEAFEMLRWFEPDVLVSDLAMRGEDGYSFIRRLRAREERKGRHVPAIALTAYVRVEDRRSALRAGFNMFVPKPVEPTELVATISNLAGRSLGIPRASRRASVDRRRSLHTRRPNLRD